MAITFNTTLSPTSFGFFEIIYSKPGVYILYFDNYFYIGSSKNCKTRINDFDSRNLKKLLTGKQKSMKGWTLWQ